MAEDVEQFLQREREEGRTESSGTFTLASSKALEKLAQHSLPRDSAWILRLVQAATAGGSSSVHIQVHRRHLRIEIRGLPEPFELQTFRRVFTDPTADSNLMMSHLAEGLRFVGLSQKRSVLLQLFGGRRNPWLKIESDGQIVMSDSTEQDVLRDKQEITLSVAAPEQGWGAKIARLFGGGGWFVEEERELRERAFMCPSVLLVDSRDFSNFLKTEEAVSRHAVPPFLWAAVGANPLLPVFKLEPKWRDWAHTLQQPGDYRPARKMVLLGIRQDPVGALWCFSFDFAEGRKFPSEISWIREGVIVDSQPIAEMSGRSLGLRIFLSSEGLPTDLSGWKLRTDDVQVRQRYRAVLNAVLESISEATECLDDWDYTSLAREACGLELAALRDRLAGL